MRKPVRSTVANRKYFQGGGLAPMKPAAPEEAVGIMASSQPLVDMVAQNAGNPQGGMSPLNFADGGLAKFQLGGVGNVPTPQNVPKSRLRRLGDLAMNLNPFRTFQSINPLRVTLDKKTGPALMGIGRFLTDVPTDARLKNLSIDQLSTIEFQKNENPGRENDVEQAGRIAVTKNPSISPKELSLEINKLIKRAEPRELTSEEIERNKTSIDPITDKQREQSKKSIKEAEAQRIEEITKGIEGKDVSDKDIKTEDFTFPFAKQEKTSVVKKSEDDETIDDVKNITGSEEKKDPTQDPVKQGEEPKTAMDETIQNINKNAEEGNQEETTKSIEDYTEEFKKAMPKFEGMTEEEKGMAILEAGLAIMGGQSPRALENISNGLQPLVKKFTKNKEQERAFNQQINIAAAKYGIERTNSMLEREMDFEMKERNLIQIYNPKTDETKSITQADVRAGKVPDGFFITADPLKSKIDSINATANLLAKEAKLAKETADLVKEQKEATEAGEFDVYKGQKINVAYREQAYQLLNAQESKQLLGPVLKNILSDEGKKMVGLEGAFATGLDQVLNAVGLQKGDETLARRKGIRGRAENIAEYRTRVGIVLNRKISSLLGEGGKTVSDNDRRLAKEIGGLWATYLSDSVFGQGANISSLRTKVTELYKTIQNDERRAIAAMKQIESDVGRLRVPGTDTTKAEQFADVRSNIFATTSGITGNVIDMDDVYDYEKNDFKEQVKI